MAFESVRGEWSEGRAAPAGEEPLTIERAISIGLANNPGVAAAAHYVEAAGAARDVVAANRLPRVVATGAYGHHLDEQRLVPPSFPGESSVYARDILSFDLVASMPLFAGGRLVNQTKAADLLEDAAAHQLERGRDQLVFDITGIFFDILAQRRVVESLEFSREALREHLRRVEEMIAVQKAAGVDRLRTEVRIAEIEQRLARERGLLAIQEHHIGSLLGLSGAEVRVLRVTGDLELVEADSSDIEASTDLEGALEQAFRRRGDYLAARSALEAEARLVDSARAGHLPTLSLQGSYGGRWALDAPEVSGGGAASADVGRIGLAIDLPIFEGGRTRATVARERANLAARRELLRALELRIRLDVESAMVSIYSASERIRATAKASEQAEESLRIERQRYELARGSITDVLDAQAALLESQTNQLRALADYRTAMALLALAVGER